MYLHIGQDTTVKTQDIIAVFDLDTSTVSKATRDYLAKMEKEKRVVTVSFELPKSFILTHNEKQGEIIYLSQLSSQTILKRAEKKTLF
ncbi:MAG: DUF370 domain-containing protein [Clostridia bacterium]|nr:DUF370 domain-containing protein [Clostridia bacterium]